MFHMKTFKLSLLQLGICKFRYYWDLASSFDKKVCVTVDIKLASNNHAACFADSDDNVDMNLEDMMVMEAIWRSIQVSE